MPASKKTVLDIELLKTLHEVMSVPTAPFGEHLMIEALCSRLGGRKTIRLQTSRCGNLLFQYRPTGRASAANLCFQSHLDHPGMLYLRNLPRGKGEIELLGGVPPKLRGARVRFFPRGQSGSVAGEIVSVSKAGDDGRRLARVKVDEPVESGAVGMWDFPPIRLRAGGRKVESRCHDDVLSVGVLVHLLEKAAKKRFARPFDVLFTRAEEVGCVGATELMRNRSLSLPEHIITLELPGRCGGMESGGGVICRLGDSISGFDRQLSIHIDEIARRCARRDKSFAFQRRLAWRGRTEASTFAFYGYRTAAICLTNVNYHNIGPDGRPTPEIVDANDLASMVTLVEAVAREPMNPRRSCRDLQKRTEADGRAKRGRLRRTIPKTR